MTRVAITGAAGIVGREAIGAFEAVPDVEVDPITHRSHDDVDSHLMEVTDPASVTDALSGADVVVHLAGNPDPTADWESIDEININGTRNVYEAAIDEGVTRVVFASTNHVAQMRNVAEPARPCSVRADAETVAPDDPPRPDSFYAVSKITGEALGSYYADRHGVEVVNLRIGWLLNEAELRELQSPDPEKARYVRSMWLSPRDCRDAIRRSVTAELDRSPLTVNVLSRNSERYLTLTQTMRELGYQPRDDSAEVLKKRKEDRNEP